MSSLCQQQEHIQEWHCRMPQVRICCFPGQKSIFLLQKTFQPVSKTVSQCFYIITLKPLFDLNLTVSIKRVPCPSCQLVIKKITSIFPQILGHFITRNLERVARSRFQKCFVGVLLSKYLCSAHSQEGSCSFKAPSQQTKAFLNCTFTQVTHTARVSHIPGTLDTLVAFPELNF